MKHLNVALIGFGKSAEIFHAPFIVNNYNYQLKYVLERNSERSKTKYPFVRIVRDINSLLDQPNLDVVVITTPNITHYEFAKISLLHNKHVIVEKPFTVTSTEADELIQIAREKNRLLSVYQNRRWDGDFITVKNLLANNLLGEITEFESHFDRYRPDLKLNSWKEEPLPGSGILYDLGSHLIDQSIQLFGLPEKLDALIGSQRENSSIDDYFKLTLYFHDLKCILKAGMLVKDHKLRFRIKGSKGTYLKNGMDPQENDLIEGVHPSNKKWGKEPEENYGTIENNENHSVRKIITAQGNYQNFYNNIYNAIIHNEELIVKPEQSRNVIRIIELAYNSNAKKSTIAVNF